MSSDERSALPLIRPDWPAPSNIHAVCTTRVGGVSMPPWDSMNLGDHVGDEPTHVLENRLQLAQGCGLPTGAFGWLNQVHGTDVVRLPLEEGVLAPGADASYTDAARSACTILTADCLPVILCDQNGITIAAAHAGWRSLCSGVLEKLVSEMGAPSNTLMAWLGPAIGPEAFEIGPEVKAAFMAHDLEAEIAFSSVGARKGHYMADIYLLARQRLQNMGVTKLYGGGFCTATDKQRFYSYRRDGKTGRMATAIWKT
ncbi:peptidoglycan editing factor PgeF [Marinobacter sp. KMM 10035]|uniref:peptidoglycan editing factor PgeF n=1 Tax=Marinobacter sp. KMM 10035 TaxID=3134034 RepID=UPI00397D765F